MEDLSNLIDRAQQGDREAFGQIYKLFYRRIYRYCYMNLYDEGLAADTCQETFIKAWKALPTFSQQDGGSLQAYLFRISRNLIIDISRKKKEVPLNDYLEIESKENLEELVDKKGEISRVRRVIGKLKGDERQIIILRYFEELSIFEVSKALNINEGAMRVKIHRILKKLKEIIKNE